MKVFNTDTNRPALRWANSQERRNAALLAVPFGILGAIGAATVPFLVVRPGTPGGLDTVVIFALGAVAIALVAVSLIVYSAARASFLERQETAAREAVEEAVADLQDELTLKALMQINRKQIEAYHLLTRQQATEAYRNSVVAMATGLLTLVSGVLAVIFLPGIDETQRITTAGLTAIGSVVGGYVSRTFMRTYTIALQQLNRYFEQPLQTSYLLAAERLIDRLGDARQDRLRIKVIDHMLGATEQSARLLAFTGVGDGAHSNGSTPADASGGRNGRTPAGGR
jgi:hypothetical protein